MCNLLGIWVSFILKIESSLLNREEQQSAFIPTMGQDKKVRQFGSKLKSSFKTYSILNRCRTILKIWVDLCYRNLSDWGFQYGTHNRWKFGREILRRWFLRYSIHLSKQRRKRCLHRILLAGQLQLNKLTHRWDITLSKSYRNCTKNTIFKTFAGKRELSRWKGCFCY